MIFLDPDLTGEVLDLTGGLLDLTHEVLDLTGELQDPTVGLHENARLNTCKLLENSTTVHCITQPAFSNRSTENHAFARIESCAGRNVASSLLAFANASFKLVLWIEGH